MLKDVLQSGSSRDLMIVLLELQAQMKFLASN